MYILTNEQMREADEYTICELGVPALLLMERAGASLAEEAVKLCKNGRVVCVCGGGNNGGDGFVCARLLKERKIDVTVVCYADQITANCRVNLEKWTVGGGEIFQDIPTECDLIVDCLYGTGFHGALSGKDEEIVREINRLHDLGVKVLSADIPSGVQGNNGKVIGSAVCADVTLCIGERKAGVLLGDGIDYAGELKCVDIGIALPRKEEEYARLFDEKELARLLPKRKRNTHKGSFGKAAIVAGSLEYTGAAYLSAAACLRSGAGYTTLFVPNGIVRHYVLKLPEILLKEVCEGNEFTFSEEKMQPLLSYSAIAYGMGMGVSEEVAKGVVWLLERYTGKLVLDADGLNSLARYVQNLPKVFEKKKCDVILTPHMKEFSRLSGLSTEEIGGFSAVTEFAQKLGVNVLLKNAVSVITDGRQVALNITGCSGQAKAGSGDVLSGMLVGLCSIGLSAYQSGIVGSYLCGKAAELAAQEIGEYALTASDEIERLGKAFLSLIAENSDENGGEK